MQEEIFLEFRLVESQLLHRLAKECAEHNQLHQKAEIWRSKSQAEQLVKLCIVDKCHPSMTGGCLQTLEVKTNLAYDVLRRAIETDDGIERYSLISSAERLYQHDIGAYLQVLTLPATRSFRHLNKGGKRIQKIEKSILQFALMSDPPSSKMGAKRI